MPTGTGRTTRKLNSDTQTTRKLDNDKFGRIPQSDVAPDPGDLIEPGDRISERGQVLPDLGVDGGDVEVDGVDAGQHLGQQEPVMVIEGAQPKPSERRYQLVCVSTSER